MQPVSGNERPDLLTSLMNMSFVLRLPGKMHLCRSSSKVPCVPSFLELLQNPHVLLTFDKIDNPLHVPGGTTSQRPKVVRIPRVLYILTSKCASSHNGVHFFDISTAKSGPHLVCFVHFDFQMCFAPQRRALFHLASGQLVPHRFSEPTFGTYGAPHHWENTAFRDFPTFSRTCIFFLHTLSLLVFFLLIFLFSLPLPCSAFHLSILLEV